MKEEYDFSNAERGKFYKKDAEFKFPIFLDSDVDEYLSQLADEKQLDLQKLVNDWLRSNIAFAKSLQ